MQTNDSAKTRRAIQFLMREWQAKTAMPAEFLDADKLEYFPVGDMVCAIFLFCVAFALVALV